MNHHDDQQYRSIISFWTLRALSDFNYRRYIRSASMDPLLDNDVLFAALGNDDFKEVDHFTTKKDAQEIKIRVKKRIRQLADTYPELPDTALKRNINWLSNRLELSPTERMILTLHVMSSLYRYFFEAMREFGNLDLQGAIEAISVMLQEDNQAVRSSLLPSSRLLISGLLKIHGDRTDDLFSKIELMRGIADLLNAEYSNPQIILEHFVKKSTPGTLEKADFSYISSEYLIASEYLNSVFRNRTKGCNILLYGEPGTGKTEFAKSVCETLNIPLYMVSSCDEDGESASSSRRISSYLLSQKILDSRQRSAIIFDEIEDVFPDTQDLLFKIFNSRTQISKAWFNEILENNAIPAFWISNKIHQIDSAYLRRFDITIKLKVPNRTTRKSIIRDHLASVPVSDDWINRYSDYEEITPATIEKASKVINHLAIEDEQDAENILDKILHNSQQALGKPIITARSNYTKFEPDLLNTDISADSLIETLKTRESGRLCFYGPPGTGKTAFAHYISKSLEKPIICKRISEILSKWVGNTEKNIAEAFQQSSDENAILLIDEIDGLLQNREMSQHSWEITQVNELLTQMEMYNGIFIATSNYLENFDQAALRRFNSKIRFDYLQNEQSIKLFSIVLSKLNITDKIDTVSEQRLSKLRFLTPSDFELVYYKYEMSNDTYSISSLITNLEEECKFKSKIGSTIGFV